MKNKPTTGQDGAQMPAEAAPTYIIPVDELAEAALVLAQQDAVRHGGILMSQGCRLYDIEPGWQSRVIQGAETTAVCNTLSSVENALQRPDIKVIFMEKAALVTVPALEAVCRRNGVPKTLFREVVKL